MADIGQSKNWLVSPTKEIEEGWLEVQIQEKISQINRTKQDIDDNMKGLIKGLEMTVKMRQMELERLKVDLLRSRSMSAEEVKAESQAQQKK